MSGALFWVGRLAMATAVMIVVACSSPTMEQERGLGLEQPGSDAHEGLIRLHQAPLEPPSVWIQGRTASEGRQQGVLFSSDWTESQVASDPDLVEQVPWPVPINLGRGLAVVVIDGGVAPARAELRMYRALKEDGTPMDEGSTMECLVDAPSRCRLSRGRSEGTWEASFAPDPGGVRIAFWASWLAPSSTGEDVPRVRSAAWLFSVVVSDGE
jgi:hypothetical protein